MTTLDRKLRKTPTVHQRISIDLDLSLKDFAKQNQMSIPDASKEVAKMIKQLKNGGMKKILRELEF